jgi:hypothetical protein
VTFNGLKIPVINSDHLTVRVIDKMNRVVEKEAYWTVTCRYKWGAETLGEPSDIAYGNQTIVFTTDNKSIKFAYPKVLEELKSIID